MSEVPLKGLGFFAGVLGGGASKTATAVERIRHIQDSGPDPGLGFR